jgi:hypothetical protein
MTLEFDFDERYYINADGRLRTPIKLISPLTNLTNNQVRERQAAFTNQGYPHQTPPLHQHKKILQSG